MSYDVMETAAIVESPSTIGMAEGADLYWTAANPLTREQVDRTLDEMYALGVRNVRVGIPWALVENPFIANAYDWSVVEHIINAAMDPERPMGVLAVVNSSPLQYGLPPGAGHPTDSAFAAYLADFDHFMRAVVDKYRGKVSAYEIWNEPNYFQFWNPVDAAAYTRLLQVGYTAVNDPVTGDPSALVIGGVVGATQTTPFTLDPVTFVQQMYTAGAHGYFDALSFHPYGNLPFTDRDENTQLLTPIEQLEAIRAVMDANGDPNLKIWISEYGVSTEGWVTEEEKQAAYDKQYNYLLDILTNWKNVNGAGPIFIYTTRDQLTGAPGSELNFGIFETDWDAKPAAELIQNIIACGMAQCPPGNPPPPTNPIAALFAQLANSFSQLGQGLSQFLGSIFAPNLFGQLFNAIGNFFGSIFGVPAAAAAAAAPPNENLALMADESDTGDASRTAALDSAATDSDDATSDDGATDTDDVAEADALPTGDDVEPALEEVEPVVVDTPTEAVPVELDLDADLESGELETGGASLDEETGSDDAKTADDVKVDVVKVDDEVNTSDDDKPADSAAANEAPTVTKEKDGTPANKPDADNEGDAGSDDDGDSEGGES